MMNAKKTYKTPEIRSETIQMGVFGDYQPYRWTVDVVSSPGISTAPQFAFCCS